MINPFIIKNPATLKLWLWRSAAWTVSCVAGFVPFAYFFGRPGSIEKYVLFLCGLTVVQVLIWKNGLSDFGKLMKQGEAQDSLILTIAATLWFVVLLVTLIAVAFSSLFGWMLLGDDGRNWSV